MLDVEYFGEIGVGLGPTKEFYTLLSYQFQLASKAMFLSGETGNTIDVHTNGIIFTPKFPFICSQLLEILTHNESGLYPRPYLLNDARNKQQLLNNYHYLGMFVAKALMDERYFSFFFFLIIAFVY